MIILATKWSTAWLMTGIGVGGVFVILVLLVFILQLFGKIAAAGEVKPKKAATISSDVKQKVEGYEEDMAAVATAVYLYLNSAHDEESGILTIQQDERSMWHAELNASV